MLQMHKGMYFMKMAQNIPVENHKWELIRQKLDYGSVHE